MKLRNEYQKAVCEYTLIYNYWTKRLYDMAISCIEWKGFTLPYNPSTILLPEKFLVQKGMGALFEDDVKGLCFLPCVGEGALDLYGENSSWQVYGSNGYVKGGLINGKTCVVVSNNPSRCGELVNISIFATRLTNSMITGDINLFTHRTPVIIKSPDELRLSMLNFMEDYSAGVPIVKGNSALDSLDIDVLNLDSQYLVDKITQNTHTIWNEWLNYLGVPSQTVEKSERVLKDEISQSMGGSIASRVPRIILREKAAEQMKAVFGMDVKPEFTIDRMELPEYLFQEEGGPNESNADTARDASMGNAE